MSIIIPLRRNHENTAVTDPPKCRTIITNSNSYGTDTNSVTPWLKRLQDQDLIRNQSCYDPARLR
jgi:hypothetical protein